MGEIMCTSPGDNDNFDYLVMHISEKKYWNIVKQKSHREK